MVGTSRSVPEDLRDFYRRDISISRFLCAKKDEPITHGCHNMNSHARVLVVSRDEMLLRTRVMILGAFFLVERAGRFVEARALLNSQSFDLIVLCHSLTSAECEQLARIAHELRPRPLILVMGASSRTVTLPWADSQLGVDAGPYGLVKKCADMLGFVLKSKARAAHV